MIQTASTLDLVILTADKDAEHALMGLCSRSPALQIRPLACRTFVHTERDPGCLLRGVDFLRNFQRHAHHALLVFDYEGCGELTKSPAELAQRLDRDLALSGWDDRAAAIVLCPELEVWVWADSPHVDSVLGWSGHEPPLRQWLRDEGWLAENEVKPQRPKEAMERALRLVSRPRSAALYRQLAEQVSLARCTDPAFLKLKAALQRWFEA